MEQDQIFVKMAVDSWNGQLAATSKLLDKLTDEQLQEEVSPGKNRGVYLLGHLVAVHDKMLSLLLLRDELYPELYPVFVQSPDKEHADLPSIAQLREQWTAVNEKLNGHINKLKAEEWFGRHANISAEDLAKEPHRNRLNVLLSRTNHLSNHRGQLALLVK
ncbi:DinB family protein [Mucilaginibacter sp. dw_454]|uniref:DinB family protein n=1 Tax=Mucilaginibacter sp. dw_454 TaxID=2720079 RepID=UPI001BD544B5|nr:DinB family protein [Mucilaginibacter sp. dw_454]